MKGIRNRYVLVGVTLIAVCVLTYLVGVFYQTYVNNPVDFLALIFIIAIYAGAVYYHLQGSEG